jgi:hypothetical protein
VVPVAYVQFDALEQSVMNQRFKAWMEGLAMRWRKPAAETR